MRGSFLILTIMAGPVLAQDRAAPDPRDLGGVDEALGTGAELAFVKEIFAEVQPWSFEINAEICGFLGYDSNGNLTRTEHAVGEEASCLMPDWPTKMVVIASYHTHSTYSADYDSEVPSVLDLESDAANEVDGYVATPGGRLWFVDSDTMLTGQLCGIGCLPSDPNFRPERDAISVVYSYQQLVKRERW